MRSSVWADSNYSSTMDKTFKKRKETVGIVCGEMEDISQKEKISFRRFLENLKKQFSFYVNVVDTETTFNILSNGQDNQQLKYNRSAEGKLPAVTLIHNDKVKVTSTKPQVIILSGNKPSVSKLDVLIYFLNETSITNTHCREIVKKAARYASGIPSNMVRERAFS